MQQKCSLKYKENLLSIQIAGLQAGETAKMRVFLSAHLGSSPGKETLAFDDMHFALNGTGASLSIPSVCSLGRRQTRFRFGGPV